MRSPRFLAHHGPGPVRLPHALDRLSERWWRLPPRTRSIALLMGLIATCGFLALQTGTTANDPTTEVLVATRDLPPGHELTAGDLRERSWPADLAPDDAAAHTDGRLRTPILAGAVLTRRHVAARGIAASLPADTVAVPVPPELLPDLASGDLTDVIGRDPAGGATVLASSAAVLASDATDVWLAVPRDRAPGVAAAAAAGRLTVAVLPP